MVKNMKQVKAKYDFKAFGQAIKEARKAKGISQLDELLNGIDETHLVIVTDTIKGIQKAREAEE